MLSINNLQTRVVLAARIPLSHTHSTTDVHPRSTPSPSSPSPPPSRQRPRPPRCLLVCIISIIPPSLISTSTHPSQFLSEFPGTVFHRRCPSSEKCLNPVLWNLCPSLLASTLPHPHHRKASSLAYMFFSIFQGTCVTQSSFTHSFTAYLYGVEKTCSGVLVDSIHRNIHRDTYTDYADTSNSGAIRSATPSNFFFHSSNLSASLPICVRDRTRGCTHVITAFWSTWSIEPRINLRLNRIC